MMFLFLERAKIVPYTLFQSCLPCWSYNKKVLNGGKDVFTSSNGCLNVTFHLLRAASVPSRGDPLRSPGGRWEAFYG